MIRAGHADQAEIMSFLQERPTVAMLPITNLRDHGMSDDHPKAMTFWMARQDGQLTDVLGVTKDEIVLPVFGSNDLPDTALALAKTKINGIVGQAASVEKIHEDLELPKGDLHRVEPHFELELSALEMPDVNGLSLMQVRDVPRETMIVWRTSYGIEAMDLSSDEAMLQAIRSVDDMISEGNHRVLMADGAPVAITGFNSVLPETVMIGGVYTPQTLRGRGYARAAVAMHLVQARGNGVKRAVLSAANMAAAKAYRAIGFQKVGNFMIIIYKTPQAAHV